MKKIILIIFSFICFCSQIFTEELLLGGGKTILYGFDESAMKIVSIKNKDKLENVLNSIEIGFFIDNKPLRMIEMNPKVEYVIGTPIIKIESSYQKTKFVTYILSPIEENKNSIFIITNIKNSDGRNLKKINSFFIINSSESKSNTQFDRVKNAYIEDKIAMRALNNKFQLYFTTEKDYRELKFRKSSDGEDEKKDGEQLFFVSETGEIERYGEKRDIVEISLDGGYEYNQYEDFKRDMIVDKEIGSWENWHGNFDTSKITDKEIKIRKQTSVFLKLAQRKDGAIIPALLKNYDYIKSEDMLFTALAFIKTKHFEEARKVMEYIANCILLSKDRYIADYGYDIGNNTEKKFIRGDGEVYSYYIQSLYLYVFSEYINNSNDISMLKKEYSERIKKQAQYLLSKIKNGVLEADCYNGEIGSESADNYLNSSFYLMEAFEMLYKVCDFYIPQKEIIIYKNTYEELKREIVPKFTVDKKIIDSLSGKEIKLRNCFVLKNGIFDDNEIRKKTFENYKEIYKNNIKEISGKEEMEENIYFAVAALLANEQNDYREVVERVEKIIVENGYVIPEYLKTSNSVKKYGVSGVDTKLNASYILMKDIGGNNGVNK